MSDMQTHVEIWERVYFDEKGEATLWLRSWNKGVSWHQIDCSIFPGRKPPFIKMKDSDAAWIEQRGWQPGTPEGLLAEARAGESA